MEKVIPEVPESDVIPLRSTIDRQLVGRNLGHLKGGKIRRGLEKLSHRLRVEFLEKDSERTNNVIQREQAALGLRIYEKEHELPVIYVRRVFHPDRAVLMPRPTIEYTIWGVYMLSLRRTPIRHPIIFLNSFVFPSNTRFIGLDFKQGTEQNPPKEIKLVKNNRGM
jgi:hypothetical protein